MIFDRRIFRKGPRATPGRFRTRVITDGVTPSLHADYKHTTIKRYHKEGKALQAETTINDTHDFGIRKRLTNPPALREIGFTANRQPAPAARQTISYDPIVGIDALQAITDPVTTRTGTRITGLRIGERRSHVLLTALPMFTLQTNGFRNRDLRLLVAQLRGLDPDTVTAGQMTYDLRRLKTHGLIEKILHSNRYQVTEQGLSDSMFLSAIQDRLLPTGLADLHTPLPAPIRTATRNYRQALENLIHTTGLAA